MADRKRSVLEPYPSARATPAIARAAALRALAESRGETVSTLVAGAIEREVRAAALDLALADADERFGPLPEALSEEAEDELRAIAAAAKIRRRRRFASGWRG